MVVTARQADRVVLHQISWEQFEHLLVDLGDRRAARLAYDNGTLEIGPELWCDDEGALKIYHLRQGEYVEANSSLALPMLPVQELPQILEQHRAEGRLAVRRAVRAWAQRSCP